MKGWVIISKNYMKKLHIGLLIPLLRISIHVKTLTVVSSLWYFLFLFRNYYNSLTIFIMACSLWWCWDHRSTTLNALQFEFDFAMMIFFRTEINPLIYLNRYTWSLSCQLINFTKWKISKMFFVYSLSDCGFPEWSVLVLRWHHWKTRCI